MFRFTHLMDPWAPGGPGHTGMATSALGVVPAGTGCLHNGCARAAQGQAGHTTAVPSVAGQELVGTHSSFSASRETIYRLSVPSQDASGKWIPPDQCQFLFLFFSYKHVSSDLDDTGLSSFHCPPASGGSRPQTHFLHPSPCLGL